MAPMRQREAEGAAAPRQAAANAGRTLAARSGRRNQTAAAAIRRRHAMNRRRRVLDAYREANLRRLISRNLITQPNAAAADENSIAPAETDTAETDTMLDIVVVDHLMKIPVLSLQKTSETEIMVDHLMKDVDVAEAISVLQRESNRLKERHEAIDGYLQEITENMQRLDADIKSSLSELESENAEKEAQIQMVMEELESEKARKAAEVQKVTDENVRLRAMLDKKETLLQATSQQCKLMALNHNN